MRRFEYVNLRRVLLIYFFIICSKAVYCDLPVHCKREQIEGEWTFRINKDIFNPDLNDYKTSCGHGFPDKIEKIVGDINYSFEEYHDVKMRLGSDYKVYDINSEKSVGSWTPVYDEGFILYYKNQVFTAFMKYYLKEKTHSKKPADKLYSSNCKKTMIGWYIANKEKNNKNWSCFFGFKTQIESEFINEKNFLKPNKRFNHFDYIHSKNQEGNNFENSSNGRNSDDVELDSFLEIKAKNKSNMKLKTWMSRYEEQKEIVKEINDGNLSWKAEVNEEFKGLSFMQLKEKIGMKKNKMKMKDYFADLVDDLGPNIVDEKIRSKWSQSSTSNAIENLETEINDPLNNSMPASGSNILNSFNSQSSFSGFNSFFNNKENYDQQGNGPIPNTSMGFGNLNNYESNGEENSQPLMIGKKEIYKTKIFLNF